MYMHIYVYVYICISILMYICSYVYIYISKYIYTNIYILIHIMVCIYILIKQYVIYEPKMKTKERNVIDSFILSSTRWQENWRMVWAMRCDARGQGRAAPDGPARHRLQTQTQWL